MLTRGLLVAIAGLALLAPAASAKDRVLTLYSPKIHSLPYVHDSKQVDLKADGVGAPSKPGLHHRLQGDGAGGQQEPEGQAAAHRQDDGAPLPLLRPRARERRGRGMLERSRVHRRPRRGAPARPPAAAVVARLPRPLRHREPQGGRQRARLEAHRDGDEPLQEAQGLLRAHPGLLHDRAAHPGDPAGDRQVQPAEQRHVLRRAGRRQEGLELRGQERLGGAVHRPHARGQLPPARRREVPDAPEPHLQAPAVQGARVLRAGQPRLQHDPPDPARARDRSATAPTPPARASRSRRARCCAAWPSTTTTTSTWPRWASGTRGS